jgi:hypothetical protein
MPVRRVARAAAMTEIDDKAQLEELSSRWEVLVEALSDHPGNVSLLAEAQWVGNEIMALCSQLGTNPLWVLLSHMHL